MMKRRLGRSLRQLYSRSMKICRNTNTSDASCRTQTGNRMPLGRIQNSRRWRLKRRSNAYLSTAGRPIAAMFVVVVFHSISSGTSAHSQRSGQRPRQVVAAVVFSANEVTEVAIATDRMHVCELLAISSSIKLERCEGRWRTFYDVVSQAPPKCSQTIALPYHEDVGRCIKSEVWTFSILQGTRTSEGCRGRYQTI